MSNQTAAKFNLFVFAAFSSFQTRDILSQQPCTLDMNPFWADRSIKIFFTTIWSSNRFDKRLTNNFLSTFKKTIGGNYLWNISKVD